MCLSSCSDRKEPWVKYYDLRSRHKVARFLMLLRMKFGSRGFIRTALQYSDCNIVLEAGCGSAVSSLMLSRRVQNCKIIGMDFMKEALVQARRTSQEFATPISLIEGDIINIPLKDNAVDLAWNIGTLEHFDDPVAVIREMRRVSNVSISFVPADLIIWKIYKLVCRMLGYPKEEEEKCRLYSKDLLRKEFEEAGYSNVIVKKVYDVLFPFYAGIGIR